MLQVDRDGKGSLTPEAITLFLDDLGLEPTSYDVKLIMQELDPRQEVRLLLLCACEQHILGVSRKQCRDPQGNRSMPNETLVPGNGCSLMPHVACQSPNPSICSSHDVQTSLNSHTYLVCCSDLRVNFSDDHQDHFHAGSGDAGGLHGLHS